MSVSDDKIKEAFKLMNARLDGINEKYIKLMAEHIYSIGRLTASDINRLSEMRRMSKNMDEIRKKIAELANISDKELEQIFEDTIDFERYNSGSNNSYVRDTLGSKSIDFEHNSSLRRLLEAQIKNTHGDLRNFSNTTVVSVPYYKAIDQAILAVRSGLTDYNTAIRSVVRNAASMGLRVREKDNATVVDYASGYSRRLDSAVRQNILDGIRDLNQSCNDALSAQFGMTGVEISAHYLCAEDHLPYQGEQYTNAEFNEIQNGLQRPFGEWNCKHSWDGIYYGYSPRAYSPEMLQQMKDYSTEKIEIDGRTKTRYQWSQEQRRLETAMRQQQDIKTAASVKGGDPTLARQAETRYNEYQQTMHKIVEAAGLNVDYNRVHFDGNTIPIDPNSPDNSPNNYNNPNSNAGLRLGVSTGTITNGSNSFQTVEAVPGLRINNTQISEKISFTKQDSDGILSSGLFRSKNSGIYAELQERMSKKHIRGIANEFGISLKGIKLFIDKDHEKMDEKFPFCGSADYMQIGKIDFFPKAFRNKEELLRTLYHELLHVKQFKENGAEYVQNNRKEFEDITFQLEDAFIADLKEKGLL